MDLDRLRVHTTLPDGPRRGAFARRIEN